MTARQRAPESALADRVALVTGGSAGIGLAVCRQLVAAGARVAMVARTTVTSRRPPPRWAWPERAVAFPLDVATVGVWSGFPGRWWRAARRLDFVCHNAGLHYRRPGGATNGRDLAAMVKVNLSAPSC